MPHQNTRSYTPRYRYIVDGNTVRKYIPSTQTSPKRAVSPSPKRKTKKHINSAAPKKVKKKQIKKSQIKTEIIKPPKTKVQYATKLNVKTFFAALINVLSLTFVTGLLCILCLGYLSLKSDINVQLKTISSLQSDLDNAVLENKTKEIDIYSSIDYQYVYERAKELGMTEVNNENVIHYNRKTLEYVKQYEDIPE